MTAAAAAPGSASRRARSDRRRIVAIVPPEGVALHFAIAGLGARFAAQLLDILLTLAAAAAVAGLVLLVRLDTGPVFTVVVALLFFLVRVPYYVAAELLWNGRTIGKRACALRVISANGRSLSPHQIVARNLMKEMEVFMPGFYLLVAASLDPIASLVVLAWVAALIVVPIMNRRRQRVGDMVAGTIVIHQPPHLIEPDIAAAAATGADRFVFLPHQLDHYGAFELQVLERLLQGSRRPRALPGDANLALVSERIRAKIGYAGRVDAADQEAFLRAFYVAQRAHLEHRQLFGDVRADKFHRQNEAGRDRDDRR